jgi:hypothetical protein
MSGNKNLRPTGPIIATIQTPLSWLPTVDLYQHTLETHIVKHSLTHGLPSIIKVVSSPRAILPGTGTGRPGHIIFVGEAPAKPGGKIGAPLTVIVNSAEKFVCTVYQNSSYKFISPENQIWPK